MRSRLLLFLLATLLGGAGDMLGSILGNAFGRTVGPVFSTALIGIGANPGAMRHPPTHV